MHKHFHNLILGVSVLPALLVVPALAYNVTEDTDLNEVFATGQVSEMLYSVNGFDGTLTTPDIIIKGTRADAEDDDDPTKYYVLVNGNNSVLNLGTGANRADNIEIENVGENARAFTVWDGAEGNIYGKQIKISGEAQGITAWATMNSTTASANVNGDVISVTASKGNAITSNDDASMSIVGNDVNVSGYTGVYAKGRGSVNINAEKDVTIESKGVAVYADVATNNSGQYISNSGGAIDIHAKNLTVNAGTDGLLANYQKGQITVDATDDVTIYGKDSAIHAGFGTAETTKAKADTSFVDIKAKNINLTADETAISAMSNGWIDLDGNLTVNAKNAILARGYATVNINESGENTVKMDGNVNFDFYSKTGPGNSNSPIDAYVNVNLTDADSYWTGNTLVEYIYENAPAEGVLDVNSFNLALSNGAVWNATKVVDSDRSFEETDKNDVVHIYREGQYYTALNNLSINNGTVNIADTTRGITVDNATVADATFNGGPLNVGTMTISGGKNTFDTNISGDTLVLANGATMNLGTNSIVADTMSLNGTLNATLLNTNKFASLDVETFAEQNGSMKLTLKGVGDYKVFKDAKFDNTKVAFDYDETLYAAPVWNEAKDTITVAMRAVEDIAKDTGVDRGTVATVSNIAAAASSSDSVLMQDLSLKLQEKLAENTPEAKAVVEHATKAVHPETESVAQSVSTSVQNTVVSLASARMSAPSVGRNGGDVEFTSGGVWAQGLFNKSKHADAFNGYTRGIALGVDGTINKDWTIGAGYSFAHSDISGTARNTEIDSNTIFVYGQYKPAEWYVNAIANYTMSDYSERGTVLDGITVTGDYDVDSFGAAVATGYEFKNGITPELGLRYMHVNATDYANSYGIKTHMDDTDFLTGVIGAKYAFNIAATKHITFAPQLSAAMKYDMLSDKNVATVTMPGLNAYTLDGNRLNRIGGEFGIGLGMQYRELNVSVNYDIDVREDYTSQTGMLKFRYNF